MICDLLFIFAKRIFFEIDLFKSKLFLIRWRFKLIIRVHETSLMWSKIMNLITFKKIIQRKKWITTKFFKWEIIHTIKTFYHWKIKCLIHVIRCTLHVVRYTLHLSTAKWSYRWNFLIRSIKTINKSIDQLINYAQHTYYLRVWSLKFLTWLRQKYVTNSKHKSCFRNTLINHSQQNEIINEVF